MRDNSIHSLFQLRTGQIHDQLAPGSFTMAMAWVGGAKGSGQRSAHHLLVP